MRGWNARAGDGTLELAMAALAQTVAHARNELIDRAHTARTVADVFRDASRRLRRLVPFDAAVWLATDPATHLPTAPTLSENLADRKLQHEDCVGLWEREFLMEDVNLFRDLARAPKPAAGLRSATRDRPARSARYREFLRPLGFDDELRGVLRTRGAPWASVVLMREPGRPAFDAGEAELLASLSEPLAVAVRDHAQAPQVLGGETRGPGLMLFSASGELLSVNDAARAWLEELAWDDETRPAYGGSTPFGVQLPLIVSSTLVRARAIAEEREHGSARARMRSGATGRWIVCHASCLCDADGRVGDTALVIEPARASEIAPIITRAYGLSAREDEITRLISQGFCTAEIAARLHLSSHTVRDYVKAIFEKAGVSSRGALVAALFAEHYAPVHLARGQHEQT
jgi:DNA-binding CsgD family transcriptional regulator